MKQKKEEKNHELVKQVIIIYHSRIKGVWLFIIMLSWCQSCSYTLYERDFQAPWNPT
jgi:hypothetical protein